MYLSEIFGAREQLKRSQAESKGVQRNLLDVMYMLNENETNMAGWMG